MTGAPPPSDANTLGSWLIPKAVVVVSSLLGVGCFVALIALLATRDSDALATTALGLAVVAFLAQWIAFAFQATQAHQQSTDFHKVQLATTDALSEIRADARTTQTTVNDQLGYLLRDISLTTKETAAESGLDEDPETFRSRIISDVTRIIYESQAGLSARHDGRDERPTTLAATRHLEFLHDWPTANGLRRLAEDGLAALPVDAWQVLVRFAKDLESSLEQGFADGLRDDPRRLGVQLLVEQHVLYSTSDDDPSGQRQYRLDGFKGRAAARVILAGGKAPAVALEELSWLAEARAFAGRD